MIHDVAAAAAAKSDVPFESDAIVALEEALEPMLEALCAKAFELASKEGRDFIQEAEYEACFPSLASFALSAHTCSHRVTPARSLRAVSKQFMKSK